VLLAAHRLATTDFGPANRNKTAPTGSEPGKYQIEIVEQPGKPLIGAEGAATLRDHIAVLEVKVDFERLHPGLYLVGIRQADWSWAYYPVVYPVVLK